MTGHPLRITVVGCGRLGSLLAERLSRAGHDVVAVDSDASSFDRLPASFGGFRVAGDATELEVLRRARVEGADVVVATTRDDNVNLFVTQAATKLLGARHAIARVFEPSRESTYRALGVETVCPTVLAAGVFIDCVSGAGGARKGA
jgi:trk system potassium uptake protein TrkA